MYHAELYTPANHTTIIHAIYIFSVIDLAFNHAHAILGRHPKPCMVIHNPIHVQIEVMQMFGTTDDEKLEQVDSADPYKIPTDTQGGLLRYHLLWDVKHYPMLYRLAIHLQRYQACN